MSFKKLAAAMFAASMVLVSCQQKAPSFYDLTITLDESSFVADIPSPTSYTVTFTETNTGTVTKFESTGNQVSVKQLVAGVYNVVASAQYKNYIGSASSVTIDSADALKTIAISANASSTLVFREIFYCCSKSSAGKSYLKDNFFEVYNNGDDTIYLDGFCIGTTSNYRSTTVSFANASGNMVDADGNDTGLKADDYLVFNGSNSIIWQIPGSGKDYPLAPGESVVLASYAYDHTKDCDKSINLESADFETFCDKYKEKGQVDNPNSINLTLVNPLNQNITNQYMPSVLTAGFALFYLDTDPANLPVVVNVNNAVNKFVAIKRSAVFDAVNWVKNATTDAYLPDDMDAGKIYCSGTYVGESIQRKVKIIGEDGRKIYQDTNNSSDDFEVSTTPTIRRNAAKIPSWSGAAK